MPEFHAPLPFSPFDLAAIGYVLVVVLLILGIRKLWSAIK
jgi:hypothetical protein